ncbi:hypothetical protein LOK49_LG04G00023 [Camellia lanceoleosa]|uniref:Uncharacterized protein n=1 Tax=Camellia lanceoleosa TaxID=1840588 RepID=A0ACC0I0D7_9ERIC|nr:hypothetical protein LOK49_LG04G00023 [Camellia lanceoleosa]
MLFWTSSVSESCAMKPSPIAAATNPGCWLEVNKWNFVNNTSLCSFFLLQRSGPRKRIVSGGMLSHQLVCSYGPPPSINNCIKEHWLACSLK